MILTIKSSKNDKVKYFRNLKQKKYRTEEYTVEGKKSVWEALNSKKTVTSLILSESFFNSLDLPLPNHLPCYILPDSILAQISSTDTPSGIIATLKIEKLTDFTPNPEKAYVYCDKISDPGNLGTIIRTADAAGFGGVLLSPECCDLYNPKTVRSSMGSFFHIDIIEDVTVEKLKSIKDSGFSIFSGVLSDKTINYTDADMKKPTVIVIGNESNGVSQKVIDISTELIKIPILGSAESLNASIAAAIIMYEVVKQRQ